MVMSYNLKHSRLVSMEADAVKHDNLSADGLTIRVHLFNVVINVLDKPLAAVGLRLTIHYHYCFLSG